MEHTIDAKNKKLGRIATEAATFLMGKNTPDFVKNEIADRTVRIINSKEVLIDEAKLENKLYKRYSGYPGGLKETKMAKVIESKGYEEIFKTAVYGMLPKNKLRSKIIKNLIVE
ncbi:50S ribosomal protein L13 [Candidatus Nomurabacteria bacterium]|nr:50S ribosomal protein L13 [Candidatus Nomurabacteria bacterium]USN94953.1 MAG: 50S ribosomal protein L13 [Candidatus Nomurabacteria bacterium]